MVLGPRPKSRYNKPSQQAEACSTSSKIIGGRERREGRELSERFICRPREAASPRKHETCSQSIAIHASSST
jgi:hypothetical protein